MKRLCLISIFLGFLFFSCEKKTRKRDLDAEWRGEKQPLKEFTEKEVAKYAIAVFTKKSPDSLEVKENDHEFSVTIEGITSKGAKEFRPYEVRMGAHGLVFYKDDDGEWTDIFKDRRIFYFEQDDKLILSEIFPGDSTTYNEFTK
jgi:hypothetical protein